MCDLHVTLSPVSSCPSTLIAMFPNWHLYFLFVLLLPELSCVVLSSLAHSMSAVPLPAADKWECVLQRPLSELFVLVVVVVASVLKIHEIRQKQKKKKKK